MKAAITPAIPAQAKAGTAATGLVRPALICVALSLAGLSVAQAQVTYFQKPPSAAELRKALMGGGAVAQPARPAQNARPAAARTAPQARPDGVRTRGIVWSGGGNSPVQQVAPPPAQQSATAPVQAPVYSNPAQQANSYQQQSAQAGPAAGMPISFASGSSRVNPSSSGFLQTVAEMLNSDPSLRIMIEGHTDSRGSYKRNMVLSWERAMGVYRVLVEQYGIDPARLQPSGKGPTEPMPGTSPNSGENRRVQFRLMG